LAFLLPAPRSVRICGGRGGKQIPQTGPTVRWHASAYEVTTSRPGCRDGPHPAIGREPNDLTRYKLFVVLAPESGNWAGAAIQTRRGRNGDGENEERRHFKHGGKFISKSALPQARMRVASEMRSSTVAPLRGSGKKVPPQLEVEAKSKSSPASSHMGGNGIKKARCALRVRGLRNISARRNPGQGCGRAGRGSWAKTPYRDAKLAAKYRSSIAIPTTEG
jgi:hypothetical protein